MGKIESRSLSSDDIENAARISNKNGELVRGKYFRRSFDAIQKRVSHRKFSNSDPVKDKNKNHQKYSQETSKERDKSKNGDLCAKEKTKNVEKEKKVKKLITSRPPRTNDFPAGFVSQVQDTSFYENDFRRRCMSESQAQMRKKLLEKKLRLHAEGVSIGLVGNDTVMLGGEELPHHVKWADTLGDSLALTCDVRRRSFSHGSAGLPQKPILKKISPGTNDDHSEIVPVDTRYL